MSNFYCAAPWRGLHITPQGNVKTCCAGDPNMLGNLDAQPIEEILHGPVLQEIRQTLRTGQPHKKYCYNCITAEKFGTSERNWHNAVNLEFDTTTAGDTEHIPTLVDVRWNTTCNLSCNYCNQIASSKWAALLQLPVKSGTRPYYNQVCDYLRKHFSHIREVGLVGGEPLLLPENERLLDVIPEDSLITIITNMSVNLDNNKIFKKLSTRSRVGWSMSFDNIGPQFEYVRYGADWDLVQQNIQKVKQLFEQGHWGGIHAVYNLYNATCLVPLFDWAKTQNLAIHFQSIHGIDCLDPLNHNQQVRDLALAELAKVLARTDLTESEQSFLIQMQQKLQLPASRDASMEFTNYTAKLETTHHPDQSGNFSKLWPELTTALNI